MFRLNEMKENITIIYTLFSTGATQESRHN